MANWFDNYTDERLNAMNEVQLESLIDDVEIELDHIIDELSNIEIEIDEWDSAYAQDCIEPEGSVDFRVECNKHLNSLNKIYNEVRHERQELKKFYYRVLKAFEATDYYHELQAANEAAMQSWYDAEEY